MGSTVSFFMNRLIHGQTLIIKCAVYSGHAIMAGNAVRPHKSFFYRKVPLNSGCLIKKDILVSSYYIIENNISQFKTFLSSFSVFFVDHLFKPVQYSAALCGPWNKNNIEATLRFFCDTWPLEYWKNFFEQSPHYIYCICLFFSDSSAFLWLLSFHITSRVWLNAWVFVYVLGSSPVAVT